MSSKLTVFFFLHVDDDVNADQVSKRMAPEEKIARIHGAKLDATALEIDESELDAYGFYVPRHPRELEDFLYKHAMGEITISSEEQRRLQSELEAVDAMQRG